MASEAFFGTKNITCKSWHDNRIRFTTTCMKIGVHRHWRFQVHPWNRAKKQCTKASQYFVTLDLIPSNSRQECVATALSIWLFSGLHSSLLCLDRKVRGGTNLCWQYACFSPASEGLATSSQSKHWSGDCRVCQTCSACPVREKWMPNRNSTIKIIQESKFKFQKLTEKVGRPRPPQPPHFWRPWSGWAMNITELVFLYRGHWWCKLL